jgi:hypothetical protein
LLISTGTPAVVRCGASAPATSPDPIKPTLVNKCPPDMKVVALVRV